MDLDVTHRFSLLKGCAVLQTPCFYKHLDERQVSDGQRGTV